MSDSHLPRRTMSVKIWAIGVCSVLLAAGGCGLLYEGYIAKGYSGVVTFPFVDRAAAERAYDALPSNAPLADRERAAARLLKADPASARSWALVSYMDWMRHGRRMTPAAINALDRSYTLSPFDHDVGPWRVNFALENWDQIGPDQRRLVMAEVGWLFQHDMLAAADLKARLKTVQNPAGRVTAKFALVMAP